ncbi:MAG: transketolase family protein [Deltaproteobacteria bacterium]|nr:transketolase family protein [Deltaproteobacteria bacterium]
MNRATRDPFGETLARLGKTDERIVVLDADLSESTRSAKFAEACPERFFEMGIQEANMISTAAGLASTGKIAFCCSFSCFITSRFDQIKVSVAYNNARVTIVGTHAGCGVGPDGYTQMALEDVAMLRTLPNLAVLQPADDLETTQIVEYLIGQHDGPAFLRLTRQKVPRVHHENYRFAYGRADRLREGSDLAIIGTGATVHAALAAASRLGDEGISASVTNIHTISPLDQDAIGQLAAETGKLMTVEDHSVIGGLGGAVCEALAATHPAMCHRVGLREFGESGSPEELFAKHHLDAEGVYREAKSFLERLG